MRPTNTTMRQIKATAADPDLADKVAAVALVAELIIGTKSQKLTAARQRELFGGVPFGRRDVWHNPKIGGFEVGRVVCFGSDYVTSSWTYAEVAALIVLRETVVGWRD